MRAPCMWGVARDPIASLGRRGAHGDGLMRVFSALSVAAVGGGVGLGTTTRTARVVQDGTGALCSCRMVEGSTHRLPWV